MNGWHIGEQSIRRKTGVEKDFSTRYLYRGIDGDLPDDHAVFHSTRLPFLPVTTLDEDGRPWGSILAGTGALGFLSYPRYTTLVAKARVWDGDPIKRLKLDIRGEALMAGIGVELSTRRRNKLAGKITKLEIKSDVWNIELTVNEALGNCPKYIAVRDLTPSPSSPDIKYSKINFADDERLPPAALELVKNSDTIFFGTAFKSNDPLHPSHLGMNIRGGRPGFVRVSPSDHRTIIIPDYSGNRFFTSLGNIEATPLASVTFVSFTTGDILYVTGEARNIIGDAARKIMFQQERLTTVRVTGAVFVHQCDSRR